MPHSIKNLGTNNLIKIDESVKLGPHIQIIINGNNNTLEIASGTHISGSGIIEIRNDHSSIQIGKDCRLIGNFRCRANNTQLIIGNKTSSMGLKITMHEAGRITIGEDCMFSGGVSMDVSDMHSIIDLESQQRINPPADITIGDHVWIGQEVTILKGARIGDNSILGAKSLISNPVPANSISAGVPNKTIKTGITWDRRHLPFN